MLTREEALRFRALSAEKQRELIESLSDTLCRECLAPLEAGLMAALPAPAPAEGARGQTSVLSRRYFDLLRAP